MGTYNLPRNVKGEGRILFIFSTKALIYTFVGIVIGYFISIIFSMINLRVVGYVIIAILGLAGFLIGTLKMPESSNFEITRKTGGENIDDVIMRAIKFKMKKNRIYVYDTSLEKKNVDEKQEKKEEGEK
mgnify:CR=1 FL=1